MTPQEEQLLNSLVERVNQTQLQEKDPDAETLLNRSLGQNPDALYILAQTVLVQNIALEQAKAQVAQLQQAPQQQQPVRATSFLGTLLGHRDPAPAQPGYQPVNPQYTQPQYVQPPATYVSPQYVPVGGGPPSFLRGAMQTAAGVAAGALAFEGVEAVLHGLGGFGHPGLGVGGLGWGGGGFGIGGGLDRPVEETVVNNYYDDPAQGGEHRDAEAGEHHFHESAEQNWDQGAQLNDANYNTSGDGGNELDDSNFDNSNVDDGSGFDDSGGAADNGGGDLL